MWRGARLSAILRAIRADAAVILTAGCTRRFPVLPTPAVEDAVLADVVEMYTSGEARAYARRNRASVSSLLFRSVSKTAFFIA